MVCNLGPNYHSVQSRSQSAIVFQSKKMSLLHGIKQVVGVSAVCAGGLYAVGQLIAVGIRPETARADRPPKIPQSDRQGYFTTRPKYYPPYPLCDKDKKEHPHAIGGIRKPH